MLFTFFAIALTIVIIIPLIGKNIINENFEKKTTLLACQSKNIGEKNFWFDDIKNLPKPVQLYFKHVLKEGQPYISSTRLTHTGLFKNDLKMP